MMRKVFKCFRSWLYLMDKMNEYLSEHSKLTTYLFQALKKEELFVVAAGCICKLQARPGQLNNESEVVYPPQQETWKKSFSFLVPQVIDTLPMFKAALKEGTNGIEKVEHLSKIYVHTADVYLEWILQVLQLRKKNFFFYFSFVYVCTCVALFQKIFFCWMKGQ
ncbi:hypothetical protein RFI_16777 [Reticulomyxa filosa]|uniref:Uncharacterized protein n=1 Tax=Reticulomyxa filosa TaxID=46433 RepID=X6N553_RETFI|nr:hypothetical protein RFI_16777 [Reticulomyxa filosa]|eukprot:ETO20437.1 hypothetical protein RFI_16777 [Reticulomyxa filosa]